MKLKFYLFSILFLNGLYSFSQSQCTNPSLTACYSYENNIFDGSGNRHHASTISSNLTYATGYNSSNNSLEFTGSNILNITSPELATQQYTYSAWVKLTELPSTGTNFSILGLGSSGGDQNLGVYNNYDGMVGFGIISYSSSTVHRLFVGSMPSVDTWYHLAVTRNQDSLVFTSVLILLKYKLSLNDQSVYYGPGTLNATIGARDHAASGSNNFVGTLDECKFYSSALILDDIEALYEENCICKNYSICLNENMQESLDACFSFENNIYDGSGFGRNGSSLTSLNYTDGHDGNNNALILTGNDFVDFTNDALINDEFTYSTWVKLTDLPAPGTNEVLISIGSLGGDQNLAVFNNHGGLTGFGFISYSGSVTNHKISVETMPLANEWYHVAVTRSSTSLSLYVNGALSQSITFSSAPVYYGTGTFAATIGARNHEVPDWSPLVGNMDETKIFETSLTPEEIFELYWVSCLCEDYNVCSSSEVQDNLIACYSFEENIFDGNGSGLNASSATTPIFSVDRNAVNKCLSLDGSNNLNVSFQEFNQQEFTYSAWARLNTIPTPGTNSMILSIGSSGGDQNLGVFNNQNGIYGFGFLSYSGALTNHIVSSGIMPNVDEWNYVTVARDASSMSIFVNGVLSQTVTLSDASVYYGPNTFTATIGSRNHQVPNWNMLNGSLDEIKIFNRVLSAGEIAELFHVTCICNDYLVNGIFPSTNNVSAESIALFPNPAESSINISNNSDENITKLSFEDLSGKVLQESIVLFHPKSVSSADLKLESGLYIAVLEFESGSRQAVKFYVK